MPSCVPTTSLYTAKHLLQEDVIIVSPNPDHCEVIAPVSRVLPCLAVCQWRIIVHLYLANDLLFVVHFEVLQDMNPNCLP